MHQDKNQTKTFINTIEQQLDLRVDKDTFKKYTFQSAKEELYETPYLTDQEITDWMVMINKETELRETAYWNTCFEY